MSSSKVLEMNSTAVSFLVQGKHEVSHCTLQRALEGFRNILNHADDANQMSVHQEAEMDSTTLFTVAIHDPQLKALEQQSMVTVYNHAFVLASKEEPVFTENEHTVPAVLLYNMGLIHHMQAMSSGNSSVLRQALQLYTRSFTLLEQASDILNDMDIMVLLALANNMGVISGSQFFDRAGAATSRQVMERVLASAKCLDFLEDEDIEIFSLNLMFLTEHQKHVLAAAA